MTSILQDHAALVRQDRRGLDFPGGNMDTSDRQIEKNAGSMGRWCGEKDGNLAF